MKYRHSFQVKGCGKFPIDMLRYDSCFPSSEPDSYEILDERKERTVQLTHYGDRQWEPGKPRWSSFGWQVVEHRVSKL